MIEAIDSAAGDVKVRGLLLRVGTLDVGWARAAELRDALVRFRRSGKPSWAHLEAAGNREYFVATGCQKIAAAPTATLDISGLAAEVTFFKGSLDKLGVEAQFEGVGKYKNAPNQFTEKGFTAPHREQMESLVGSLFDSYVSAVAEGRGMPAERVRALVDEGPFEAAQAKAAGLVDALLYRDEVEAHVGAAQGVGPGRYVRALRGLRSPSSTWSARSHRARARTAGSPARPPARTRSCRGCVKPRSPTGCGRSSCVWTVPADRVLPRTPSGGRSLAFASGSP